MPKSKYEFQRNLAVIIGINSYSNGIPRLETAVSDAIEIARILKQDYKYDVRLLLDKDATLEELGKLLAAFQRQTIPLAEETVSVSENHRVLFYFAGHGIALDALESADGPAGYLIPHNAHASNINTYLLMQELHNALVSLPCRHLLTILDCCFAGAFRWSSIKRDIVPSQTVYKERYERFISDRAWQVIASAAHDQKALDFLASRGTVDQHSPFAAALLTALSGDADTNPPAKNGKPAGDGVITATELYSYLRDELETTTEKLYKRQTPGLYQLSKHDKGEYIFLVPGHELNLPPAPPLNRENNPYRGLKPFDKAHSHLFFGRQEVVKDLSAFVNKHQLTVVLGASGTGKSSLVKAGLIPDLENAVENQWQVLEPIRPGEFPMTALARASLQMSLGTTPEDTALIDAKSQDLRQETRFALDVATWSNAHPQMKLLLVVDQFEELVTMCRSEQERQQFLQALSAALISSQLYIVLTLRSDFEPQFLNSAFPSQWMNARFLLRPMTQDELREVIEKPAAEKVLYFEPPDLVDRLINEVVQMPGALPLLSFTLSELYIKYLKRRGDDRALSESDYNELGGVAGSLTQRATQEYGNLVKLNSDYEDTVRHVMLRMVTVEGGELARRRVPKSELVYESAEENNRVKTVIEGFSAARLLVEGKEIGDEAYIEPAHDALVRGWDKLQQWKNAQQESLVLRQRLTPAANDWQNQEHNSDYLWSSDPRLAVLEKVLKSADGNWLNKLETEFVNQSIQKRHDELEETKERLRISEERRRLAQGRQLAAQSELVRSGGAVQLSVLLAVESMQELLQVDSSYVSQADQTLRNGLALLPLSTAHHNAVVNNIVFSPDGRYFATASDDKTAKVWEVSSGKEIIRLPHDDQVTDVAFSPDGKYVATASNDKTARLWERSTAREVVRISHTDTVGFVTFSPDGKYLATFSNDKTAKLWDVNEGKEIAQFPIVDFFRAKSAARVFSADSRYFMTNVGSVVKLWDVKSRREIHFVHKSVNNHLHALALSPNGKYLATSSDNNTVLWDISSHKEIATLEQNSFFLAFSPDSKYLATSNKAYNQENVRLWDVKTGKEVVRFPIYSPVNEVAFSPDAKYLATASDDYTARIWNIQSREKIADFYHESGVQKISFSPDGKYLATASFSRDSKNNLATASKDIAGVWDATNSKQITRLSQNSDVSNIAFDRDGRYLTIASKENFGVWKVGSNQKITFLPYNAKINRIDLSPDGKYIATVSEDETVWLWNVNTDQKIVLLPHKSQVTTVKFSPNGKYLASFGKDKVVQVWEANNGKELARFQVEFECISTSLSMSLDGRYVAIGSWGDQNAEVWEVNSRKRIFRLPRQYKNWLSTIALSPDGQYLVTMYPTHMAGYTGLVYLWQTKSNEQTPQRLDHDESDTQGSLTSIIQFSPDGEYFVTAPSTRIPRMWETKSGREVARYPHDFGPVTAIAFSSDNKYVVTASADRTVKIWDARKGQEIALIPHDSTVNYGSIAFSPDNKYIVTATNDKTVQLSFIRPEDLIAETCRRLNRNLSWNEWRRYFGNDLNQYRRTYPSLPIHPSFITEVVKSKNIEEAVAILRNLLEQNIPSNIDQTIEEARRLVAPDLLKMGKALVTEGKIKEAIDAYTKAEQFDPTLEISVDSLYELCWVGSHNGYAAEVMDACEKAVTLNCDPATDGSLRDVRGVAKVLTGDTKGAISDFQAAVAWYEANYQRTVGRVIAKEVDRYKSLKLQRQNWINTLSAGQNPFTEEEIRLNPLER